MKVLTSGRMDPPHPGHYANIIKLAKEYDEVIVVVLDSPTRRYPICYCMDVLKCVFDALPLKVKFFVNKIHFGEITREELEKLPAFDVYSGGNLKVLKHLEDIGVNVKFIDRSYYYEASKIEMPK